MSSWIKLWNEMQNDPKILALNDEQYRFWINALQMAGTLEKAGQLGTAEEIALVMRKPVGVTGRLLGYFQKQGMIACSSMSTPRSKPSVWTVVNFAKRQGKPSDQPAAIRERVRRHREKTSNTHSRDTRGVTKALHGPEKSMKRPRNAQEEKRREETLRTKPTTTAMAGASPVDNSSFPELFATVCRITQTNPEDSSAVENCRSISAALEDHHPELTPEMLASLYEPVGCWWHKTFYPELANPMPPAPGQILDTIDRALLETGIDEPR